ncbi:hypothetical protein GCK72_012484 [Caenorhabditis remanei]|uniref:G-protein coupled receptors family 1 profile domain-containing protein n=1 Tax=Caenorhabditis remanei TaxID=31234 RepID=A0A6A5GN49_CAERE|nr:hypothetical protein GCK72_012484 [Caenorhabditis remanei]KAF1756031.1 hypothetical protein GCK72_012484 [Caenorhabditis remanei]
MSKKVTWVHILDDFNTVALDFLRPFRFPLAVIAALVNAFHILVLSRKSMRSNCINVIMIGIGICDLYVMGYKVQDKIRDMIPVPDCSLPYSYTYMMVTSCFEIAESLLRRLSAYLAVLMATVRVLVVKNPLNAKFDSLSTPMFAIKSIILLTLLSAINDAFYYAPSRFESDDMPVKPPARCGYGENFTAIVLVRTFNIIFYENFYQQVYVIYDGISKELLTTFNPTESSENRGVAANFLLVFSYALTDLQSVFNYLVMLNTMTHCVVSLAISSQYRDAVFQLLPCLKLIRRKKPDVIQVEASSSRPTRGSVNLSQVG